LKKETSSVAGGLSLKKETSTMPSMKKETSTMPSLKKETSTMPAMKKETSSVSPQKKTEDRNSISQNHPDLSKKTTIDVSRASDPKKFNVTKLADAKPDGKNIANKFFENNDNDGYSDDDDFEIRPDSGDEKDKKTVGLGMKK
tara:strand:+ start:93 stop:521 length:429 start_codon:yes stop_codon:yes gene_type:complete